MIITNIKSVANRLAGMAKTYPLAQDVHVIVGYTARYALHVHERTDIPHKVGQAKFLEQPARDYEDQIGSIIVRTTRATKNLAQGLVLGGLFLQRQSQKLVPVDTGNLKGSAFTKKVNEPIPPLRNR